jgi:hypothetical protein
VDLQKTSVSRYFQKVAQKRNLIYIFKSAELTDELLEVFKKDSDKVYQALLNMAGQIMFTIISHTKPGKQPDLTPLHNTIELMIAARKDGRADRRFLLEREKWEIDVARLCAHHHAELQAIAADDSLDEGDRLQAIRRQLFGANVLASSSAPKTNCPQTDTNGHNMGISAIDVPQP